MAYKMTFITFFVILLVALSQAVPADRLNEKRAESSAPQDDLVAENEKGDLKAAASHWGGYGGYGGWGGHWGHYGGYYPYWGSSYWGYPGYGYGYGYGWPGYGFGHHGYWW